MASQHKLRTLYSNLEKGPAVEPASSFWTGPFFEGRGDLAKRFRSVENIWTAQHPGFKKGDKRPWARFREREDKTFFDPEFSKMDEFAKYGLAAIGQISRGYTGPKRGAEKVYNWYTRIKPRTLTTPAMPPNYNPSAARGSRFTIPKETKE